MDRTNKITISMERYEELCLTERKYEAMEEAGYVEQYEHDVAMEELG